MRRPRLIEREAEAQVALFNRRWPVGSEVFFWPGVREGDGRKSLTRSPAFVAAGHTPAVLVSGYSGWIALSHVEPFAGDQVVPGGWWPAQAETRGKGDGGTRG